MLARSFLAGFRGAFRLRRLEHHRRNTSRSRGHRLRRGSSTGPGLAGRLRRGGRLHPSGRPHVRPIPRCHHRRCHPERRLSRPAHPLRAVALTAHTVDPHEQRLTHPDRDRHPLALRRFRSRHVYQYTRTPLRRDTRTPQKPGNHSPVYRHTSTPLNVFSGAACESGSRGKNPFCPVLVLKYTYVRYAALAHIDARGLAPLPRTTHPAGGPGARAGSWRPASGHGWQGWHELGSMPHAWHI